MTLDPKFQELYAEEYLSVYRSVYVLAGDRELAEDATQEAFARALERWRRLRGEPWVAGWVTATALNVARRAMRRRRGEVEGRVERGGRDPDEAIDLWRGIRALPPRQQEAVILHYAADLPIAEVAAAMRCEEGTVKAHLAKAREALRRRLEGLRDEE